MSGERHRDLGYALELLVQNARLIPNRQDGGYIVLLDPVLYMELEDISSSLRRKEAGSGGYTLQGNVIPGAAVAGA